MCYRMASPTSSLQLGTFKRSSSDFSSLQASKDERIETSQFSMAILECETSAQIGGEVSCIVIISGSSVQSLSLATYPGGQILVAF